ncbi:MAG: hypothetical protein KBF78_09155 [Fuscovulum sp.]|nr:hypothetical protein [Fuscovulum sp.]
MTARPQPPAPAPRVVEERIDISIGTLRLEVRPPPAPARRIAPPPTPAPRPPEPPAPASRLRRRYLGG